MLGMYFVWSAAPNGQIPAFVHQSAESAKKEAERLAKLFPGTEFHVLQSIAFCVKQEVEWHTMPGIDTTDLPF